MKSHKFFMLYFMFTEYRAWQINEINGINGINEINDGLINLCKLGPGLMLINGGLMRINGTLTFRHKSVINLSLIRH